MDSTNKAEQPWVKAGRAILEMFMRSGLFKQAERDNRRHDRVAKREAKHTAYARNGLNGPRAMARRARQGWTGDAQFPEYRARYGAAT